MKSINHEGWNNLANQAEVARKAFDNFSNSFANLNKNVAEKGITISRSYNLKKSLVYIAVISALLKN